VLFKPTNWSRHFFGKIKGADLDGYMNNPDIQMLSMLMTQILFHIAAAWG